MTPAFRESRTSLLHNVGTVEPPCPLYCSYNSAGLNYLITIDSTGKLRWARNGELVDTTAGRYKDAGGGRGIVPFEAPDITHEPRASFSAPSPDTGPSSGSNSSLADSQMMHYVGLRRQPKNPVKRVLWKNFTLKGLVDKLLRKTIKRNTWIYVSVSTCSTEPVLMILMSCRTKTVRACVPSIPPNCDCLSVPLAVNIYIGIKGESRVEKVR